MPLRVCFQVAIKHSVIWAAHQPTHSFASGCDLAGAGLRHSWLSGGLQPSGSTNWAQPQRQIRNTWNHGTAPGCLCLRECLPYVFHTIKLACASAYAFRSHPDALSKRGIGQLTTSCRAVILCPKEVGPACKAITPFTHLSGSVTPS